MTNRQVAAYSCGGPPGLPARPARRRQPRGRLLPSTWLAEQQSGSAPLIYATAEPAAVQAAQAELGTARAGQVVEEALAACALAARDSGARRFVVAGGETSGAVASALGIDRLDIGPEIAPGVPWCFAVSGGHPVAITLKSGNFGTEHFFTEALGMLQP